MHSLGRNLQAKKKLDAAKGQSAEAQQQADSKLQSLQGNSSDLNKVPPQLLRFRLFHPMTKSALVLAFLGGKPVISGCSPNFPQTLAQPAAR